MIPPQTSSMAHRLLLFLRGLISPTARIGSSCDAPERCRRSSQPEFRLQHCQAVQYVPLQLGGHLSLEVQQRAEHTVLMAGLRLLFECSPVATMCTALRSLTIRSSLTSSRLLAASSTLSPASSSRSAAP